MSDTHLVELEIDDRRYEALEAEAGRLGLEIPQLVMRATSAWLVDMTESHVSCLATATAVAQ
jgi:hypothetical protein